MNLLNMERISKSYTQRMLLDQADFSVNEGDKVGIIGVNGTGKSTLLKIAAGLEQPDEGMVTTANGLVIGYLPQNPVFLPGEKVLDSVLRDHGGEERWTLESEAKSILTRLGIYDFQEEVAHLSGGQRKRLALAAVTLKQAGLLILDEPTNHLDSEMAQWLEDYLNQYKGALIMVTHDRYFLDRVTNRIVEIDHGRIYNYDTNYLGFLELKAQREEMEEATERKRQSLLRTEIAWMRRGARARSTKQKAHIQRYEALAAQKGPVRDGQVEISSLSSRMGRTTVELEGISKAYGDKILIRDFTYIFLKRDRIGVIGPNGCGKTTLMKILAGAEQPDAGTVTVGQTIRIGYFSQENEWMDEEMRVIDYVREGAEIIRTSSGTATASQMLERFLFPPQMQYARIGRLSGGEKRRLYLLRILMEAPNVLLLDEPTNDLDIQTLTILEDYLDTFDGIVVAVSHDRYFLDRTVSRIFAYEGEGRLTQYEGGYTDYQAARDRKQREEGSVEKPVEKKGRAGQTTEGRQQTRQRERKLRFTFQEQKDYETIEEVISGLEEQLRQTEAQIGKEARNYTRLRELTEEKDRLEQQLEEKMERWMYLSELAEKIESQ